MVMARLHSCFKHWWMRGFIYHNESAIAKFKKKLSIRVKPGLILLYYAVSLYMSKSSYIRTRHQQKIQIESYAIKLTVFFFKDRRTYSAGSRESRTGI